MKRIFLAAGGVMILGVMGFLGWKFRDQNSSKIFPKKEEIRMSLRELIAQGKEQVCSWKKSEGDTEYSGKIYVAGKKFRQEADSRSPTEGRHRVVAVSDGEYLWVWGDEMGSKGVKMKIDETIKSGEQINWNDQLEYECKTARILPGMFEPTAEKEFEDSN